MLPSEIIKKRISEKSEITAEDKQTIELWLARNQCSIGKALGEGAAALARGESIIIDDLYRSAIEIPLSHLVLKHGILPFNSLEYLFLEEIIEKIKGDSGVVETYSLLILADTKGNWNSWTVSNFIGVASPLLSEPADTNAVVLAHEFVHLQKQHAIQSFRAALRGCGKVDLSEMELMQEIEADTCSVDHLLGAGYNPLVAIDYLRKTKEQVLSIPDSEFIDPRLKQIDVCFLEHRIENLKKILTSH